MTRRSLLMLTAAPWFSTRLHGQASGLTEADRLRAQVLQERQARLNAQVQLVLEQSGLVKQLRELDEERRTLERDLVTKLGGDPEQDRIGNWTELTLAPREASAEPKPKGTPNEPKP